MARVAVVGANGYVGRALSTALEKEGHEVVRVTRENHEEKKALSYDIVINAAMPSARFKAKQDPEWDYAETVQKTADLVGGWQYKKFIQISTVSARCQLDTVYGRNKAAAEALCDNGSNLIVRLGAMYSPDLAKGVLVDIAKGNTVYVSGESRYCFAPLDFITHWIATHLDSAGIHEVGAKDSIALKDIAAHLKKGIVFDGPLDHQEIVDPEPDFPSARDVLSFMDTWAVQ